MTALRHILTRQGIWIVGFLLVIIAVAWFVWHHMAPSISIPTAFAQDIPDSCRQVVLVLASDSAANRAQLWLLDRTAAGRRWKPSAGPFAVTLGTRGLGWGVGLHTSSPPSEFPLKSEGDKRSPAGVFRIPFAFGTGPPESASHLRLPYRHLTPTVVGVDDPKSRFYNQVVDSSEVEKDWESNEPMSRRTKLYEWGAFIAHNPEGTPGLGSCIFFHLWPSNGKTTSGCTAMSAETLQILLRWLDSEKKPLLVQGVAATTRA